MNLNKELKTIKGYSYEMSFPVEHDLEAVRKEKGVKDVKLEDLPRETVRNVLLNCISHFAIIDKKDVFYVQTIGGWVVTANTNKKKNEEEAKLKAHLMTFLTNRILPQATFRIEENSDGKKETKGLYTAWVMGQVYDELGVEKKVDEE